jgi:UDP-N-acetylmuramyl tripeptide synthase
MISVALARTAGHLSRRLGRGGGTSLPGMVLLRMRPDAVGELASDLERGVALVSATNGKTTTARLIAACLRAAGWPVVSNPSGANLLTGVATALLDNGAARCEAGLFEVDEAALPEVARQTRPRLVLLMNLFRDQLDRYGELELVAARWAEMVDALPANATVIVNADDPAVATLGAGRPNVVAFGLDDPEVARDELPHAADSTRCRACAAPLRYERVYLGHMGHWRCPACGATRPAPQVRATRVELDGVRGMHLRIETPRGPVVARLSLPGLHNAYNATAAVAAALALGVPLEVVPAALEGERAAFGRAERVRLGEHELVLLLAKNPASANEIVQTVLLDPEPLHVLMALNDRTADGHDVSWIWDVDYEPLLPRLADLTVTGDRAYDLALRFRYAGLPTGRIRAAPIPEALDAALAATPAGRPLYVLPTYTAMLELRGILQRAGATGAFWRDG